MLEKIKSWLKKINWFVFVTNIVTLLSVLVPCIYLGFFTSLRFRVFILVCISVGTISQLVKFVYGKIKG